MGFIFRGEFWLTPHNSTNPVSDCKEKWRYLNYDRNYDKHEGKLEVPVWGAFEEGSKDAHDMIHNIATAIAREKWRGLNYDNMKACRGMYKRIMYKEFSILIGRETSILRSNRLTLAIQDQYMTTQSDYHFNHQIEMEARHQQHVDRFGNRGGVIMV